MLPYFRRLEHTVDGDPAYHGRDGPLWCSPIRAQARADRGDHRRRRRARHRAQRRLQRRDAGRRRLLPPDDAATAGAAAPPSPTCKPARGRPNLRVETDAQALRARVRRPARKRRHLSPRRRATRPRARGAKFCSCAGALQSPQLLQLSGIGPRVAAAAVRHSRRARAARRRREPAGPPAGARDLRMHEADHDQRRPQKLVADDAHGHRVRAHARRPDGDRHQPGRHLRARASPTRRRPTCSSTSPRFRRTWPDRRHTVSPASRCRSASCVPSRAVSCAIRTRRSARAARDAAATICRRERDRATLGRRHPARAQARRDSRRSRLTSKAEYRPGPAARTDADLLEFARNTGGTIFHPSGTCRMGDGARSAGGRRSANCACTAFDGLRVVDCSVMPTLVSGNTNVPVIMIAEKAARHDPARRGALAHAGLR